MWYKEDNYVVRVGGNTFQNVTKILTYRREPIFNIYRSESSDELGIDFDVYDSKQNKIAVVKKGRIYGTSKPGFNIDADDSYFKLSDDRGKVLCEIKKNSKSGIFELDVTVDTYLPNGQHVILTPTSTNLEHIQISGNKFEGPGIAINVE